MKPLRHFPVIAAAFGLQMGTLAAQSDESAQLQGMVVELQGRIKVLEQGITAANRAEKEASEQLAAAREQLEALGASQLGAGDERLLQAVADLQIQSERNQNLESSAANLSAAITTYLRSAVASDPEARLRVETAMRELDEVLGLSHKPAPLAQGTTGSAARATVMSIDAESGLLVLNIGERQQARIGSTYTLLRGDQSYGTAVLADVRSAVSGAFVESLDANSGPVRIGDIALLETE
jgi:chromosome segregation ATPase